MSQTPLSLAGFQVILIGRFWVIAEVTTPTTQLANANPTQLLRGTGITGVNPQSPKVKVNTTQPFTITGTAGGIDWKVNDAIGGNATIGTIETNGVYKAPSTVPDPPSVTITAVSQTDKTQASTIVTIVP